MSEAITIYGRIKDRRSANGYLNNYSNNVLIEASNQTNDRKFVPCLDYDPHRNVSALGRRTLLSIGRWIYSNFPMVKGALNEQAEYASSTFIAQYGGANQDWGFQAEAWLREHDKICDVAGWPYNMRLFRRNLLIAVKRDGDCGVVLVKTPSGYPLLQVIPAHRIGSWDYGSIVEGGEYDGSRIIDGVIVNDYGQAVAYRVLGENIWDKSDYTDVSADDMFLVFRPEYTGQVRGFSALGASLFDWQDIQEKRRFELIAQKMASCYAFTEENEQGEPPPGSDFIIAPATGSTTAGTATGLVTEVLDGGTTRYFKSRTGSGLKYVQFDRPSENQQAFEEKILRANFAGIDWSIDFALDPTKIGGASMRVVVEKLNRAIEADQDLLIEPACRRIDGYRLSRAMKMGLLPWDDDWWKFSYQGPARLTADAKYDSEIDLQESARGLITERKACAKRGDFYEETFAQKEAETGMKWDAAKRLSQKAGITIQEAYNSLWLPGPNGLPAGSASDGSAEMDGPSKIPKMQIRLPVDRTLEHQRDESGRLVRTLVKETIHA